MYLALTLLLLEVLLIIAAAVVIATRLFGPIWLRDRLANFRYRHFYPHRSPTQRGRKL